MGSVSGQVWGGLGTGLIANADARSEAREGQAERDHQITLQRMRETALTGLQEKASASATATAKLTREQTLSDLADQRKHDKGVLEAGYGREDIVREDTQAHALELDMRDQWAEYLKSGSFTSEDNKWEMHKVVKGEIGPFGLPVGEDTLVAQQPGSPFSFVQNGLTMLPYNYTEEETAAALKKAKNPDDIQKSDTKILLSKAGKDDDVSSKYLEVYGFLPSSYHDKLLKAAQNAPGAYQRFSESFRVPANAPQAQPAPTAAPAPEPVAEIPGGMLNEAAAAQNAGPSALPQEAPAVAEQAGPPALPQQAPVAAPAADVFGASQKDRAFKGYRDVRDVIRTKPWITNPVMRYKMRLDLSPEDEVAVAQFLQQQQPSPTTQASR